jgi:uncharacterized repeat protein (TIGR01451 family)
MKFPNFLKFSAFTLLLLCIALSTTALSQSQDPQNTEPVPVDSLIIPMDNVNQGNAGGTTFNLRAYGLVNRLLQNNIPVKWAIKFNKTKDAVDFTANVTRVAGTAGSASGNINFSGGPFIVAPEYLALATAQIASFNGGPETDVVVYKVMTASTADIRYTLTHKPLLAIGPDGGNFGSGVYQDLLTEAGIPDFTSVTDESMQPTSCYTMAMQAHSVSTQWVSSYRGFVENGGNLILECASINTFENNDMFGHFQTSNDWTVFGTNTGNSVNGTPFYPNPFMPFSQFIGDLNGNQDGAITDYQLAPGSSLINGTLGAARHGTAGSPGVYIATVSKVGNVGQPGGHVFELGGHDYKGANITDINGRRMVLNTIFVPVTRPCAELSQPQVEGYKSVRMFNDVAPAGLSAGDTVTWEIVYINRNLAPAVAFQINDSIAVGMNYVPGSLTVSTSGGAIGSANNPAFNGTSNTNVLIPSLLNILPQNGKITVSFRVMLVPPSAFFENQSIATGFNVPASGIKSDNLDANDAPIVYPGGNVTAPAGSFPQEPFQTPALDPTWISYLEVTAAPASVTGRVVGGFGQGLRGVAVRLVDFTAGRSMSTATNAFGYYTFTDLEVGHFYMISVSSKKYNFASPSRSFSLTADLADIDFVGSE